MTTHSMIQDINGNIIANSVLEGYNTTATAASTTTLTVASAYQQFFTGTTTQTVILPVTSTLVLGQSFSIVNDSTGTVTVQSSGSNTIQAQIGSTTAIYTCILTSGTTAASWSVTYINNNSGGSGTVSSGTIGQVAVYAATGTTVSGAASSSVGGYRLISHQTASNSASIVFTGLTSSYSAYRLIITNVTGSTNATSLLLRCSTNNGSSYDSGSNYQWVNDNTAMTAVPTPRAFGSASDTSISIYGGNNVSSTSGQSVNVELTFFAPNTAVTQVFAWFGTTFSTGNGWFLLEGSGVYDVTTVNAIEFLMSGGNINTGDFYLYGLPTT